MNESDPKSYWEKRLASHTGLTGVGYISLGQHYNNWLYKVRQKVFLKLMKSRHINFSATDVVDIGSGTGFYIEQWKKLGVKSITGTDITTVAVNRLQEKYPGHQFYQMDIGDSLSSTPQAQYDIVSAFDVLFHIVDDSRFEKAIENIHTLLRPEGLFIFSDNFLHRETSRSAWQASRSLYEIESVLAKTGFTIVQRTPMFVLMNSPIDSQSRWLHLYWRSLVALAQKSDRLGFILCAFLYPLELFLIATLKESPTTEIMICKKTSAVS